MLTDTADTAIRSERPAIDRGNQPFLGRLEEELDTILNTLNQTSTRLVDAGFYGPPASAPDAVKPAAENNVRSRLVELVTRLQERSKEIFSQVERAC